MVYIQIQDQIKVKIQDLYNRALRLPNGTHPDVVSDSYMRFSLVCVFMQSSTTQDEARIIREVGKKPGKENHLDMKKMRG